MTGMNGYVRKQESDDPPVGLPKLKAQLAAWVKHCKKEGLQDRMQIMECLAVNFTHLELASIIEQDIGREAIREAFLASCNGPLDKG